jgi:hypothetical protein
VGNERIHSTRSSFVNLVPANKDSWSIAIESFVGMVRLGCIKFLARHFMRPAVEVSVIFRGIECNAGINLDRLGYRGRCRLSLERKL